MGILIALLEREQSGEGQWVKSSLLGAQISMLDFQAARWTIAKDVPGQAGNNHPTSIPTGVFKTADGYINIAAAGDDIYRRLCKALGTDYLATDPMYATGRARSVNRDALNEAIGAITVTKTSAEWIESLNKAGVPCGPIYQMNEVFADPQVQHLGMTRIVPHKVLGDVEVIGQPIELSRTPWSIRSATPEAGEHTDGVLAELGYSAQEIARLHAEKIV
jgi:crotonobetainyl-CoA:carnitine CoA-transferase CaiB-like acyl-CoA transferase